MILRILSIPVNSLQLIADDAEYRIHGRDAHATNCFALSYLFLNPKINPTVAPELDGSAWNNISRSRYP